MPDIIAALTSVLALEFTLGTVTFTLGGIAIGLVLIYAAVTFFRSIRGR